MSDPIVSTMTHVLLVEPDPAVRRRVQRACAHLARVTACADFLGARARLLNAPHDVLISNLRLGEYNGMHLFLLAKTTSVPLRCAVMHTDRIDLYLIREAQRAGAFFERTDRLAYAVRGFLSGTPPPFDRRDPARIDRRTSPRGGRRAPDLAQMAALGTHRAGL